jgi:tetratricopeptide (TPR) repeat protein
MTMRTLVLALLLVPVLLASPVRAEDGDEVEECATLPESAMKDLGRVMDLVQARKLPQAAKLADQLARKYPCHTTLQARASCAQLSGDHKAALADFRRAYRLEPELYDLEAIARSQIATGNLQGALGVVRELKSFQYKSDPEKRRGMRCIDAIMAAAQVLLEQEKAAAAPSDESEGE